MPQMVNVSPVQFSEKTVLILGGVAVVLVIGVLWYAKRKVGQAIDKTAAAVGGAVDYVKTDAVNLTSSKNIPSTAVNTTAQVLGLSNTNDLTGGQNTLGSQIYEFNNGDKNLGINPLTGKPHTMGSKLFSVFN